jgi:hypothetical protein
MTWSSLLSCPQERNMPGLEQSYLTVKYLSTRYSGISPETLRLAMSRLIQWNMLSLDGYFEGAKSLDVEWFHGFFSQELEKFSIEQLRRADSMVFGRVTSRALGVILRYKPQPGE